jgi:hypothetical protein
MMMEAIRSSDTSVLKRATGHDIPEDGILQHYRRHTVLLQAGSSGALVPVRLLDFLINLILVAAPWS